MSRRKKNAMPAIRCNAHRGDCKSAVVCINGRRHYLGPYGSEKSIEKYHRLIAEWLASGRSPTFGLPIYQVTVSELTADYLRHCETYYGIGPNSEHHRTARVVRSLCELYGTLPVTEFGVLQFKAVRQRLIDEGLARRNINAMMKRVVRLFKWAAGEGRIAATIPDALAIVPGLKRNRTTARETDPIRPIGEATVEATLPHLSKVVADMVRLQRLTGMRPAEVCILRPSDINRSGDVWEYRPTQHKTAYLERERVVFMGPQAQCIIRPYLLRAADAYCFSPAEVVKQQREAAHAARKTRLSCGNRPGTNRRRRRDIVRRLGDRYDPRSYRRAIYYGCVRAEVEPWAPNRLRHAAATDIRKHFGLEAAQVVLGHSQANVTQVYAKRDMELASRVALAVG